MISRFITGVYTIVHHIVISVIPTELMIFWHHRQLLRERIELIITGGVHVFVAAVFGISSGAVVLSFGIIVIIVVVVVIITQKTLISHLKIITIIIPKPSKIILIKIPTTITHIQTKIATILTDDTFLSVFYVR